MRGVCVRCCEEGELFDEMASRAINGGNLRVARRLSVKRGARESEVLFSGVRAEHFLSMCCSLTF